MKKTIVALAILALICVLLVSCKPTKPKKDAPDMHTTQISVDWNGTYYGEIPAASGPGIIVRITLSEDEYYEMEYRYIDRSENIYTVSGPFTWAEDGSTITLEGLENYPCYYWVSEGYMIQLDMKGRRITGDLAKNYILVKEPLDRPLKEMINLYHN